MFNIISRTLSTLLMLCTLAVQVQAQAADTPAPPAAFGKLVPRTFGNGLRLVDIRPRCENCTPWRIIKFTPGGAGEPARQEKVSVGNGITAMYAFLDGGYFANTKIEKSVAGSYERDKAVVSEALEHECSFSKKIVAAQVQDQPAVRDKLEQLLAGREQVEFKRAKYRGIEYLWCTQNATGAIAASGTLTQLHIFVPQDEVIVTAYLMKQKTAAFRNIDEFLQAQTAFVEGYIDFLVGA
jgi:hypothetical protein